MTDQPEAGTGSSGTFPRFLRPNQQEERRLGFFDLETQRLAEEVGGWGNKHLMRLSVGVVYDTQEKRYFHYREEEVNP